MYLFHLFIFIQNACQSAPCLNNGTCQNGFTHKMLRCLCPAGCEGELCEKGNMQLFKKGRNRRLS